MAIAHRIGFLPGGLHPSKSTSLFKAFVPSLCPSIPTKPAVSFPPPAPDAIAALRGATAALHRQLDQNLPLGRQDATLADYASHLRVVRDWQLALQPWLARTCSSPDALGLIAQDLADCAGPDAPLPAQATVDLTPAHRLDDGSAAFCWGVAYVLEGSRLGGEILYRRLQAPLAPHPLRYLGRRELNGPSWPEMLGLLRTQLPTAVDQARACRGAVMAFELLLLQFRRAEVLA